MSSPVDGSRTAQVLNITLSQYVETDQGMAVNPLFRAALQAAVDMRCQNCGAPGQEGTCFYCGVSRPGGVR